jgi:nucleotide-binding universal stress UspA family protein
MRPDGPLLLLTDGGPDAHAAGLGCAALARQLGRPLLLAPPPVGHHPPAAAAGASAGGAAPLEGARLAAALEEEARRLAAVGATVEVCPPDSPRSPEALGALAEREGAALVVLLGGGLAEEAERLVRACARPVLSLRTPEHLAAWVKGARPLKVALGVDASTPARAALAWAGRLGDLGPVEVVAVHAYHPAEALAARGMPHMAHDGEVPPALLAALERDVAGWVAPLAARVPVRVRLELAGGRVVDPLVDAAEAEGAELLVVGTHHRRGVSRLWSVSHHALRLAPMSVLCVPTRATPPGARPQAGAGAAAALRSVLVATDLSEAGNGVVPWALGLLAPGGVAHLLHVGPGELSREERRGLCRTLLALAPQDVREGGRAVRCLVEEGGDVGAQVAQAAERLGVDAVLLAGSSRPGGLRHVLMGSVTERVLQRCRRPVLVYYAPPPS